MIAETAPWLLLAIAFAGTFLWRALGVAIAGRVRPEGALIDWITAVAFALVAGLCAKLILSPSGSLADTALAERLAAAGLALLVFYAFNRSVFAGLLAGVGVLWALSVWLG